MDGLAKFRIESAPTGRGTVEVNGQDVTQEISGLAFDMRPGQPPLLTLHFIAAVGVLEGEGIVHAQSATTDGDGLVEFLDAINPKLLEEAALEESGWGDNQTEIMLTVLKKWASGGT